MNATTKVINMCVGLESSDTVMIGTPEATKVLHINHLCKHARTMCMMYEVTGEQRYLQQAKSDLDLANTIKVGFLRPFSVHQQEAA
jgi:hypothetical protein